MSFNHVSVKNPNLDFKFMITERTSSILGAKGIVLASRTLGPNADVFCPIELERQGLSCCDNGGGWPSKKTRFADEFEATQQKWGCCLLDQHWGHASRLVENLPDGRSETMVAFDR